VLIVTVVSFRSSGVLLYSESLSRDYYVEYQTDSGVTVSAHITDDTDIHTPSVSGSDQTVSQTEYTVNINTASAYELEALLPGIGEKKAQAIVEYRQITGGFDSIYELLEVPGIGEKLFEKISPYCTTE